MKFFKIWALWVAETFSDSKWGLYMLVHKCPRLPTIVVILRREVALEGGPKGPQKCTIVDDCGALRKGPPFHGSRSSREIKSQNASCQMGGREVTR